MKIILDPLLLAPPVKHDGSLREAEEFWLRVLSWSGDKRARVGEVTCALIYSEYALHGYPDAQLTAGSHQLRRDYQVALSKLLSRVQKHTRNPHEASFSAQYRGDSSYFDALKTDLSGTADTDVSALATAEGHWVGAEARSITVSPGPPEFIELCYKPDEELRSEGEESLRKYYEGKRIHIVGGQVDENIKSKILARLSMSQEDLLWLPCEKAKPPRNLDRRWASLDPYRDITMCITGRVGHATSIVAAKSAAKVGAVHVLTELPSGIEQALVDLARVPQNL